MKDRKKKKEDCDSLREQLEKQPNVFVTSFDKLTVAQDFELRKTIRGAGGSYRVVKNTVAGKASDGLDSARVLQGLNGTTAVALTEGDPVTLAKALTTYAKNNPAFTFKSGLVEGRVINLDEIQALANLPAKEEIYAKLLYVLNAPAQRLVSALSGVGRNVAVVIDQGVKENKFSS